MNKTIKLLEPILQWVESHRAPEYWPQMPQMVNELVEKHRIIEQLDINDIPHLQETYTRNAIEIDRLKPFEMVLTRWNKDDFSVIHGHPAFLIYYPLSGSYDMDFYDIGKNGQVQFTHRKILQAKDYIFHLGNIGKYDNCIHQIFAREPAVTLHIYSEDAKLGLKYA